MMGMLSVRGFFCPLIFASFGPETIIPTAGSLIKTVESLKFETNIEDISICLSICHLILGLRLIRKSLIETLITFLRL